MFRKAAVALALAASVLGIQAIDLSKVKLEGRKLTTKPAAHTSTRKAKTVELCLVGVGLDLVPFFSNPGDPTAATSYLFTAAMDAYNCADVNADGSPKDNVDRIGYTG